VSQISRSMAVNHCPYSRIGCNANVPLTAVERHLQVEETYHVGLLAHTLNRISIANSKKKMQCIKHKIVQEKKRQLIVN